MLSSLVYLLALFIIWRFIINPVPIDSESPEITPLEKPEPESLHPLAVPTAPEPTNKPRENIAQKQSDKTLPIPIIRCNGKCEFVKEVPPGALEIPESVVEHVSREALRCLEDGGKAPWAHTQSQESLYIMPDGKCRNADKRPVGGIKVPVSVLDFLAEQSLKWLDEAN